MHDYYLIGEIKSSFKDKGYVSVYSYSDFIDRFFDLNFVFIEIFGVVKKLFVEQVELSGDNVLIKFQNFNNSKIVQSFIGCKLFVDKENLVELDDDNYFIHDLIGCKAYFNDTFFGDVVDVLALESNDVYVIHDSDGKEHLVPAVKDYIKSVDINRNRIELFKDWNSMFYDED